MDDDDFTTDADFLALANAVEKRTPSRPAAVPQPASASSSAQLKPKVTQPTPQAIHRPSGPTAILVSPRQKGNPVLTNIKSMPWEYSDTPADYVLGATTCALFLSLKYHRLHPEYIYQRIKQLSGKYNLRVLLTMVDIDNHEEPLRELAKTSLVNNFTLILAWSAREAARYLEAYKALEHAPPTGIRGQQAMSYAERMTEFVTVPRGINKADAVGLVSAFGSVRAAVNARKEEIASIQGWGEVKVKRWHESVREPFRVEKTKKKKGGGGLSAVPIATLPTSLTREESMQRKEDESASGQAQTLPAQYPPGIYQPDVDEEEVMRLTRNANDITQGPSSPPPPPPKKPRVEEPQLSDSMRSALAKHRS